MKNSLFRQYFTICSMCVLASIIVLGVILMTFASRFFERDKYAMLERSVVQAADVTAQTYTLVGPNTVQFNTAVLDLVYSNVSTVIDGELWLADVQGNLIYYSDNGQERAFTGDALEGYVMNKKVVAQALSGQYMETGTLGGLYVKPQYIFAVPVEVLGTQVAVLFAASPTDTATEFMSQMLEMFLSSSFLVLIIAFILIYFITSQMVRPLKQMLSATHSFSKGDFTVRVPVEGYDELGQLAMAFNNMASTLATTESSRRSFVANVSHELKTPMTTIGGFVDGILDGTVPEEKRDQYLQIVSAEVKRLSRLVRSMLDTTRIEAGEMEVKPTWFDISELNRQTIFSFEQRIEEKRLMIEGLETDHILVYADRDLMNQVIYNLVENAVKFVNEQGVISFDYRETGSRTYVIVRNTGEGLENDEIPRLFDRFYKSDRSRSLNKNGVGLGLHIVKSIINYHHGEVVVRSKPGEYTEFEIAIPLPPKPRSEEK